MIPAEHAEAFAAALLGDHGELLSGLNLTLTTLTSGDPRTRWVAAASAPVASAAVTADATDDAVGVYLGVGLTRRPGPRTYRLSVADTVGIAWLWADVDIASDVHGSKPYPPGQAEAISVLRDTGLAPTVLLNSGHGIQAHWRLADPWIFGQIDADDDGRPIIDTERVDAERAAAVELAWAWTTSLRIRARRLGGWHTDPTSDLARLVRVPGTHNRKTRPHRLAQIIDCDPSRRYDRDDINAALAPNRLLEPYRNPAASGGVSLEGVDLAAAWAAARSAPGHVPEWLDEVLAADWDPVLARIWSGAADDDYSRDDSAIDMALAAAVLRNDLDATHAVEAIMARRLRIGRKVDKVDPAGRAAYYLARTVGRVAARLDADAARVAAAREQITATVAAAVAEQEPPEPDPGPGPEPDAASAAEPELDGDTARPSPVEDPSVEDVEAPVRSLRIAESEHDPVTEFADAPREPVAGLHGPQPAPPDATEMAYGARLSASLGLPEGFGIWGAQQRKLSDGRQMRLWLSRDATAPVARAEDWPAGRLRATDWRPKRDFDTRAGVAGVLRHDLDIFADPAREWPRTGLVALYRLLRTVRDATPGEFVRLALLGLLGPRSAAGSLYFSVARDTGDPYVVPGAGAPDVWLPVKAVAHASGQLGYSPGARAMLDVLAELGCKISAGMAVVEEHRTVRDSAQWVRPPVEVADEQLWAEVVARASERDQRDGEQSAALRRIGGGESA